MNRLLGSENDLPSRALRPLGQIVLLQVQQASLKVGERPHARYNPAPLLVVDSLLLTPNGVVGLTADGGRIVDVHNSTHPQSRNRRGANGISVGFTSHYRTMRERFGSHLIDGIAGENILVTSEQEFTVDDLQREVVIQNSTTGEMVILANAQVAAPCIEFSHFAAKQTALDAVRLQDTLRFLHDGRRGFYLTLASAQHQALIQLGDRVYAAAMPGC